MTHAEAQATRARRPHGPAVHPQLGGGRALDTRSWWTASPDERLVALAAAQHGVVSHEQALGVGLSDDGIAHRVVRTRLHRVHRGVYAVGLPARGDLARRAAALLAAGRAAVLSHGDAGVSWALVGVRAARHAVELTVPRARAVDRVGVVAHRSGPVPADERRRTSGIVVTSPARTLVDLAPRLDDAVLEASVADARRRRLVSAAELRRSVDRAAGRPGVDRLRRLLDPEAPAAFTRSGVERLLLLVLRSGGAPPFETNALVLGHEVDVLWRAQRLIVEVDAYGTHGDPLAFETDRRRDAELLAAGYRVLRITRRRLLDEPDAVLGTVLDALTRCAA